MGRDVGVDQSENLFFWALISILVQGSSQCWRGLAFRSRSQGGVLDWSLSAAFLRGKRPPPCSLFVRSPNACVVVVVLRNCVGGALTGGAQCVSRLTREQSWGRTDYDHGHGKVHAELIRLAPCAKPTLGGVQAIAERAKQEGALNDYVLTGLRTL